MTPFALSFLVRGVFDGGDGWIAVLLSSSLTCSICKMSLRVTFSLAHTVLCGYVCMWGGWLVCVLTLTEMLMVWGGVWSHTCMSASCWERCLFEWLRDSLLRDVWYSSVTFSRLRKLKKSIVVTKSLLGYLLKSSWICFRLLDIMACWWKLVTFERVKNFKGHFKVSLGGKTNM